MTTKLPIRSRRTIHADGLRTCDETAYCDHRQRSLPVDDCIACSHCTYIRFTSRGDGGFLTCDRPGNTAPRVEGTVASVMAQAVHCVRADVSVEALAVALIQHGIGGVPVVDDDGRAIGIASKTDVVRCVQERRPLATTTVAEIMTPVVFSLREDATVEHAAALMAFEGVHRIPVVARDGLLVGIVTPLDVARAIAARAGYAT